LSFLTRVNSCYFLSSIFLISSGLRVKDTFEYATNEGSFGLGDEWLFGHDLGDELVDVGVFGEVQKIDAFGLDFAVFAYVLEDDAGRVVADEDIF
jgi:hypothetical protein